MGTLVLLLIQVAAAAVIPGEYHAERDGEQWRITVVRHDTMVDGRRTLRVAASGLEGSPESPPFRLKREAGVFEFSATGKFTFTPDEAFAARIRGAVRNWWEPGVAFEAAVTGLMPLPEVRRDAVVHTLRIPPLPPPPAAAAADRERLRLHGVTPDYLRRLRQSGYDSLSTNDLIQMRSQGINANDLSDFQSRGYRNLSVDEMVRIKNEGFRTEPKR